MACGGYVKRAGLGPACGPDETGTRGVSPGASASFRARRSCQLGLTFETVSRMLSRLDRAHSILLVPAGVRLLDPARLERLAAS